MKKNINIFLASSEELSNDRVAFGDFIRSLNDIYQRRNISIRLMKWEDFDSSVNTSTQGGKTHRKQDEYNQKIGKSDIFVALFYTKAGKFTIEEFDYAIKLFEENKSPKIFVYFKDLDDYTKEDKSLSDFKSTLYDEIGHYWGHYNSQDSLHFNFVMQLLLQIEDSSRKDDIKVEDGQVKLYDVTIASMQSLGFASGNDIYQQMRKKLSDYPQKIEKLRSMVDRAVDEEMRQMMEEQLQDKLNEFNDLKEKCMTMEKNLLDTALRITKMEQENVSEMVRRAIAAFDKGDISLANELLDEVAHEAENHFEKLESQQELVHKDIDALLLQAKTVMADVAAPIEARKERTIAIYKKAELWAKKSMYNKEKYEKLLSDYYDFLRDYGYYKQALDVLKRECDITISLYGEDSQQTAWCYCGFGGIYGNLGGENGYQEALDYYDRGIRIAEKIDDNEQQISVLYNNKAIVLDALCRYEEALDHYQKALAINEKLYGKIHNETATVYGNIADIYDTLGRYEEAAKYMNESYQIKKNLLGEDHLDMTWLYLNMARNKINCGEFVQALDLCQKALDIRKHDLGALHPKTASAYKTMADIYGSMEKHTESIKYLNKVLQIYLKVYGEENDKTASVYQSIGDTQIAMSRYKEGYTNLSKALVIYKKIWGKDHMDIVDIYESMIACSFTMGNYKAALDYGKKAKKIASKILGEVHSKVASINSGISQAYSLLGNHHVALAYARMALLALDENKPDDIFLFIANWQTIGIIHYKLEHYSESIEAYQKIAPHAISILGENSITVASIYIGLGQDYQKIGEYQKALDYFKKTIEIYKTVLGESCAHLASTYLGLARTYKDIGDKKLWGIYLNAAFDQAIDCFGEEHPYTKELKKEMLLQDCPFYENARNLI